MDFAPLLDAVEFGPIVAALLAIAGLKVAPLAAGWGIRKVLSMIGR